MDGPLRVAKIDTVGRPKNKKAVHNGKCCPDKCPAYTSPWLSNSKDEEQKAEGDSDSDEDDNSGEDSEQESESEEECEYDFVATNRDTEDPNEWDCMEESEGWYWQTYGVEYKPPHSDSEEEDEDTDSGEEDENEESEDGSDED